MTSEYPFLSPEFAVRWSELRPECIERDVLRGLELAKEAIEGICESGEISYEATFGALEGAGRELGRGWGRLSHLDSVADDGEQRAALNRMLPLVSEFYASIPLNARLWGVLKRFAGSDACGELDEVRRRYVAETLLDFEESGANLGEVEKVRVGEIEAELSQLTKQYSEHVLDDTNAYERWVTDEEELAGLPESARGMARAMAVAKGRGDAWLFTLQAPSFQPVMQYADCEGLRRDLWWAFGRIGSEGERDNGGLVGRILGLRDEKARILGFGSFADLVTKRRMAGSGAAALRFVEDLHGKVVGRYREEYGELCAYRARVLGGEVEVMEPWDVGYWAEKLRRESFDLDEEELRPYFAVDRVMGGMFELATRLFGIRIEEKCGVFLGRGGVLPEGAVEVWHPEVSFYEIRDEVSGAHLGSFYADWHPRESKRSGAWMNSLHTGGLGEAHLGLIVGNMSPPVDGRPALLTHGEVETVFHEFGHLLHGMLSEVGVKALSGTSVAWDFVELPSQIMENFCWERESLDLFARHVETGECLPEEMLRKMRASRNYMSATVFVRQLSFAKLDLELHVNCEKYVGRSWAEVEGEILRDYRVEMKTAPLGMLCRFLHLFSSSTGYAAGYYSYKWAEVLDADAFTRFQREGILNGETGRAFRASVLSRGNSAPAEVLFREFMGREPDQRALLERAGLV